MVLTAGSFHFSGRLFFLGGAAGQNKATRGWGGGMVAKINGLELLHSWLER